jgi:Adenylate cyclase regulatory domain
MWLITIVDNDSVLDFEALAKTGLLDGLDAGNRAERAELIAWLLEQGFGVEQIPRESALHCCPCAERWEMTAVTCRHAK